MTVGMVFDLRRYSVHDGPGIRTAVFLKGCPLRCAWCHNPEGLSFAPGLIFRPARCILCDDCLAACPQQAVSRRGGSIHVDRDRCRVSGACAAACPAEALELVGREMSVEAVLAQVERDRVFYARSGGGVTFTGGEPLAQPEFLLEMLSACRSAGLHTAVDTSGYAPRAVLEGIHTLVDLFLYDLKLMDPERHRRWTGVSNEDILSNLEWLSARGAGLVVRLPLVPGINDAAADLRRAGEFLAGLSNPPPVEILPYHDLAGGKYAGLGMEWGLEVPPAPDGHRETCSATLETFGLQVLA